MLLRRLVTVLTRLLVLSAALEPEQAPEVRQTDVERGDPGLVGADRPVGLDVRDGGSRSS